MQVIACVKSNYIGELLIYKTLKRITPREVRLEIRVSQTKEGNLIKRTKLTGLEKEVILGSLLGDGTLEKAGNYHYRFRFCHMIKHVEYTKWKYGLIKRICISDIQYVKANNSYRVGTVGHSELTRLRSQWYVDGKKEVPLDLQLTPLMLAI